MKNTLVKCLMALLLCGSIATFTQAQSTAAAPKIDIAARSEQQIQHLKTIVKLTDAQVAEIEAIDAKYIPALKAIQSSNDPRSMENKNKIKAILKQRRGEIRTVLTDEQKIAFKESENK
jgi:Spy/CpxP family protein refolding chaperone